MPSAARGNRVYRASTADDHGTLGDVNLPSDGDSEQNKDEENPGSPPWGPLDFDEDVRK